MNKKVLSKVIAAVLVVGLVNNVSAGPLDWIKKKATSIKKSVTNTGHKAYNAASHNTEVKNLAQTGVADVIQGKDPRKDIKAQAEGDAVNYGLKKIGVDTGDNNSQDTSSSAPATGDASGTTQDTSSSTPASGDSSGTTQSASTPASQDPFPVTDNNQNDGNQLQDNNYKPFFSDGAGNFTLQDGTAAALDNDNDVSGAVIGYDSNNNQYSVASDGTATAKQSS